MKIALATPTFPSSIQNGLQQINAMVSEAASQASKIICFPESFLPGYPLADMNVSEANRAELESALEKVCAIAKQNNIAIILPMDWFENDQFLNVAFVISNTGQALGYQAKCQLDPTEDNTWLAEAKECYLKPRG